MVVLPTAVPALAALLITALAVFVVMPLKLRSVSRLSLVVVPVPDPRVVVSVCRVVDELAALDLIVPVVGVNVTSTGIVVRVVIVPPYSFTRSSRPRAPAPRRATD